MSELVEPLAVDKLRTARYRLAMFLDSPCHRTLAAVLLIVLVSACNSSTENEPEAQYSGAGGAENISNRTDSGSTEAPSTPSSGASALSNDEQDSGANKSDQEPTLVDAETTVETSSAEGYGGSNSVGYDAADAEVPSSAGGTIPNASGGTGGAGSGSAFECAFDACGGDPLGVWSFSHVCFLPSPVPSCPELTVTGSGMVNGTYSVTESTTTANLTVSAEFQVTAPIACLNGTSCSDSFASLGSAVGAIVETREDGDLCIANVTQPPYENELTRTIAIESPKLVDEATRETEFCQNGDQLQLKELGNNPFGIVYTLERL